MLGSSLYSLEIRISEQYLLQEAYTSTIKQTPPIRLHKFVSLPYL